MPFSCDPLSSLLDFQLRQLALLDPQLSNSNSHVRRICSSPDLALAQTAAVASASALKLLELLERGGLVRLRLGTEFARPNFSSPSGCCRAWQLSRSARTDSVAAVRCFSGRHLCG